ncbi:MAG: hypothetical protein IJS68_00565 [Clostridia bacterium]|nr:hypothetical protein [Clostridia bacterium]
MMPEITKIKPKSKNIYWGRKPNLRNIKTDASRTSAVTTYISTINASFLNDTFIDLIITN